MCKWSLWWPLHLPPSAPRLDQTAHGVRIARLRTPAAAHPRPERKRGCLDSTRQRGADAFRSLSSSVPSVPSSKRVLYYMV